MVGHAVLPLDAVCRTKLAEGASGRVAFSIPLAGALAKSEDGGTDAAPPMVGLKFRFSDATRALLQKEPKKKRRVSFNDQRVEGRMAEQSLSVRSFGSDRPASELFQVDSPPASTEAAAAPQRVGKGATRMTVTAGDGDEPPMSLFGLGDSSAAATIASSPAATVEGLVGCAISSLRHTPFGRG